MIKGIDVSSHQDRVDWQRVKTDRIAFACIKGTEGVGLVDPKLGAYKAGASAARIPRGFYHLWAWKSFTKLATKPPPPR